MHLLQRLYQMETKKIDKFDEQGNPIEDKGTKLISYIYVLGKWVNITCNDWHKAYKDEKK